LSILRDQTQKIRRNKMEDFKPMDELRKLVEENGDEVGQGSTECDLFHVDHTNCDGCKYNLGCAKLSHLGLIMLLPAMYNPTSFDDFLNMTQKMTNLQKRVMEAKSMEELKGIPMGS